MNNPSDYTTNPLSLATQVAVEPEFIRLPRYGERDPVFSLTRGYLNTLVLPSKVNGFKPPVKSCVLRKRGARTGVRLVDLNSLRNYIRRHEEPNSGQPA